MEAFFAWLKQTVIREILLPSNPFGQAARYALEREAALKVFLADPAVPMDTNHLEREIRTIAVGRRNWLFCWTEVGARHVGIFQSLLASCRLQGVDPYVYLVDVPATRRYPSRPGGSASHPTPVETALRGPPLALRSRSRQSITPFLDHSPDRHFLLFEQQRPDSRLCEKLYHSTVLIIEPPPA